MRAFLNFVGLMTVVFVVFSAWCLFEFARENASRRRSSEKYWAHKDQVDQLKKQGYICATYSAEHEVEFQWKPKATRFPGKIYFTCGDGEPQPAGSIGKPIRMLEYPITYVPRGTFR